MQIINNLRVGQYRIKDSCRGKIYPLPYLRFPYSDLVGYFFRSKPVNDIYLRVMVTVR